MNRGFSFAFPVTIVVSTIAFVYFCTVFVFIDRWFGLMTSPGIMNAVAFTGFSVMCVLNYALVIIMDPGRVPSTFLPDIEDSNVTVHEIKRKICVLRMDHHCIWINNCVGHANYKVFFVFVVYAVIACIYSLVLLVGSLTNDSQSDEQQSADSFRIIYVISGLLLVPLSMALSVLLGWHIYLILQNKSTIEYHEGVRAMGFEEKEGNACKHPYDRGAYENLIMVLGPRIFCWICPTSKHIGDGLRFQTAYDSIPAVSAST